MVLDLVKQAILIKIDAKFESPLISPAEYCYASAYLYRKCRKSQEEINELKAAATVEELMTVVNPFAASQQAANPEDASMVRLCGLLTGCRVTGEITEEIRQLFD